MGARGRACLPACLPPRPAGSCPSATEQPAPTPQHRWLAAPPYVPPPHKNKLAGSEPPEAASAGARWRRPRRAAGPPPTPCERPQAAPAPPPACRPPRPLLARARARSRRPAARPLMAGRGGCWGGGWCLGAGPRAQRLRRRCCRHRAASRCCGRPADAATWVALRGGTPDQQAWMQGTCYPCGGGESPSSPPAGCLQAPGSPPPNTPPPPPSRSRRPRPTCHAAAMVSAAPGGAVNGP